MPSDPAERTLLTGHPRLWVAGLVLVALGVLGAVLLVQDDTAVVPTPGPPSVSPAPVGTDRVAAAAAFVNELASVLATGTRAQLVALAEPGNADARKQLVDIHHNLAALDVSDLAMRYVDENAGRVPPRGPGSRQAYVVDVELTWRLEGLRRAPSRMEVSMTLAQTGRGASFVSVGGDFGNEAPLWLLEDLAVRETRRALVMVAEPADAGRFLALANRAVADVRGVLPGWRGRLVVAVPESRKQLEQVLGTKPGTYDSIAAVTTTVDGSTDPAAPTQVVINPGVFEPLSGTGEQIVISHEATHVATNAATSLMPLWLLEGFADYVALAGVELPVAVTAGDFLADVRREGPPHRLPTGRDFDPANQDLGATYESAWLACRYLAQQHGEQKLVAFYRQVEAGSTPEDAFRSVLGTSTRQFLRGWRAHLRNLAG